MSKAILTDIEGTTSSIAFVKEVLFPYAEEKLPQWLKDNRHVPAVSKQLAAVAKAIDSPPSDLQAITDQLLTWIRQDVKATPLKALQGLLWQSGYENGDYVAHIYEDAVQKLQHWHELGVPIYVYSSGSVKAQELFFQYSRYGDLRGLFAGHFDTNIGAKTEQDSYKTIAAEIQLPTSDILFLSDIEAEIDAATAAGMDAILVVRPEDSDVDPTVSCHQAARSFHEITIN